MQLIQSSRKKIKRFAVKMHNHFVPNVSKRILILGNKRRDVNKSEVLKNSFIG